MNKVGDATSDLGDLGLRGIPVNVANAHHSPRLSGHFIVGVERVNRPFGDPLVWIDVLIIELEVMSLSRLVLLRDGGLRPFYTLCSDVILAAFDVPERPIHVRPDLGHVADIELVVNKSLRLSYICLRLKQLGGRVLTEQARLLATGRLLV